MTRLMKQIMDQPTLSRATKTDTSVNVLIELYHDVGSDSANADYHDSENSEDSGGIKTNKNSFRCLEFFYLTEKIISIITDLQYVSEECTVNRKIKPASIKCCSSIL